MKHTPLLLAVFLASAMVTQAASIKWSIGGELDTGINTSVGSFVLAYIGTTSGTGVDAATFNTEMAKGTDSAYSVVDTGAWTDFFSSRTSTYSKAKSKTVADVANATYQVFYVNDGVYSLVNAPTMSTMAISIDPSTGGASTTAYVNNAATSATTMFAAGGSATKISSVPEPSVALMGLLGLGMLLKRRRA